MNTGKFIWNLPVPCQARGRHFFFLFLSRLIRIWDREWWWGGQDNQDYLRHHELQTNQMCTLRGSQFLK